MDVLRWDISREGVRQAAGQVLEEYGKSLMQQSEKNSEGFMIPTVSTFTLFTKPYGKSLQQSQKNSEGFMNLIRF